MSSSEQKTPTDLLREEWDEDETCLPFVDWLSKQLLLTRKELQTREDEK